MSWSDGPFLGFDLETTGLNVETDRLVTAGLVRWENGQTTETEWLADPGIPISYSAAKIHGISTEYAQQHGRPLSEVVPQIRERLAQAIVADTPIVIFNAQFDLPMIEAHFEREGLPRLADQFDFIPVLDPLVLDRMLDRYRRGKRKLANQAEVYGIDVTDALHDALADVRLTIQVLRAILDRYPQLRTLTLPQIKQAQADGHKDWALNFRQFLESRGRDASDVQIEWL